MYAVGNACIGASPVAYAADVMPANLGGFGLGMYRCAGDLGMIALLAVCKCSMPALCYVRKMDWTEASTS